MSREGTGPYCRLLKTACDIPVIIHGSSNDSEKTKRVFKFYLELRGHMLHKFLVTAQVHRTASLAHMIVTFGKS